MDFKYKVPYDVDLNIADRATLDKNGVFIANKEGSNFEAVTTAAAGKVADPGKAITIITSTGAHGVTLADGLTIGQRKLIVLAVDGGTVTLTPAHLTGGMTITFDDANDWAELIWGGSAWIVVRFSGVTVA